MSNVQTILGTKAQRLIADGALLIDVRDPVAFRDSALPNAVNVSLRQLSSLQRHPKTTVMIVYGDPADNATLSAALNYLTLYGFKVYSLGNIDNWFK